MMIARRFLGLACVVLALCAVSSPLRADDEKEEAKKSEAKKAAARKKVVDPSGTWRMEYEWNGATIKDAFRLNLAQGGKVVGALHRGDRVAKVEKGKVEGDRVSFMVTVNYDGTDWVTKYSGKIKGDEIDGKVILEVNDESREFPWNPKRGVKLEDVVGTWRIRIEMGDGNVREPTLTIVEEGGKLKGAYASQSGRKLDLKNLRVEKNQLLFTVLAEVDGNSLKADYRGRPYGDKYAGKIDYDFSGNSGTVEFAAKRDRPAKKKASKKKKAEKSAEKKKD